MVTAELGRVSRSLCRHSASRVDVACHVDRVNDELPSGSIALEGRVSFKVQRRHVMAYDQS